MNEAQRNELSSAKRVLDRLVRWIFPVVCSHRFAIEDLSLTGIPEPEKLTAQATSKEVDAYWKEYFDGEWQTKRVKWPCSKCGKVFTAHCGLDISPKHGPTFRRNST